MATIRRVIAGKNAEGKTVFSVNEDVEPMGIGMPYGGGKGGAHYWVWSADGVPAKLPSLGYPKPFTKIFPPSKSVHVFVSEMRPKDDPIQLPPNARFSNPMAEAERHWDEEKQLVSTDSIDIGFVISGEITLEVDDGASVVLKVGDIYILNGAAHRWRNHTNKPCQLGIVMLGTTFD